MLHQENRRRCDLSLEPGERTVVAYRGYRCIGARSLSLWDRERREKYLIVPDVPVPISLDTAVTSEALGSDPTSDTVELLGLATTEEDGDILIGWRFPEVSPLPAFPLGDEWLFLGFDICDRSNISGLMNCAASSLDGKPEGYWRLAVNRYHLFDRSADANTFRNRCNARISEHAPFVLIALFARLPSYPETGPTPVGTILD
jgi:hypothetical protein